MATSSLLREAGAERSSPLPRTRLRFWLAVAFATLALIYSFIAGLRTIADFDLGWQMATGRWIVQHHQIPSTEVFSYTAAGQPWVYPVGAGIIFYFVFLIGGYKLISWMVAAACVAAIAILVRRLSLTATALTILAVPLILSRITARAEMFTTVLFALALSILWHYHQTGRERLWVLPILMLAWVNLHPGFIAGLGLLCAYVAVEVLELFWNERRAAALVRLRLAWPWLLATACTSLLNPWGWAIFKAIVRQDAAMRVHTQLIQEWAPIPLDWTHLSTAFSLGDPDEFYLLFFVVIAAIAIALWRRQLGAALLLAGATLEAVRHIRFAGLFAVVTVIVASSVLSSLERPISDVRIRHLVISAAVLPVVLLSAVRMYGMVTDTAYRSGSNLVSFGTGLSWWFPQKAADFVERENLPGNIFSTGSEGAFMAWRLGPRYKDYIDGRAIPFGTELMLRSGRLKASEPDSVGWQKEAARYNINVILVPIGRYGALQFFPVLRQFCDNPVWQPVYLDEVSAVFLRRTPETKPLISRLQIDCATTPIPSPPAWKKGTEGFNQWANAASVLHALGRDREAFTATENALAIYPNSGYVHWVRGHIYRQAGDLKNAEAEYIQATEFEPRLVAPWSAIGSLYQEEGRTNAALCALKTAADVSKSRWEPLVTLGYAELEARNPAAALDAFNQAAASLPAEHDLIAGKPFLANIAHGRARSWFYLGDLNRAVSFEEEAAAYLPDDPDIWHQLAELYTRQGRLDKAADAQNRAQALTSMAQARLDR